MRRAMTALLLLSVILVIPSRAGAHPLHTTFVSLGFDARTSVVTATVKVFTDDFVRRVTRGTKVSPSDDAAVQKLTQTYLANSLVLSSPAGAPLRWKWCGWKRSADLIFICLSAQGARSLSGLKIRDVILNDVFSDQVNILQAEYGGRKESLLFIGDGAKQLP